MKVSYGMADPTMIYLGMKRIENRNLTDPEEIEKALRLGNYIKKGAWLSSQWAFTYVDTETLALYSLRKYRHLKKMYPDLEPHPVPLSSIAPDLKS